MFYSFWCYYQCNCYWIFSSDCHGVETQLIFAYCLCILFDEFTYSKKMLQNLYVFLYIRSYNLWTETILLFFHVFLVLFISFSFLIVLVIPVLCWLEVVKTSNLALILILRTFSISPLSMMFSEGFSYLLFIMLREKRNESQSWFLSKN